MIKKGLTSAFNPVCMKHHMTMLLVLALAVATAMGQPVRPKSIRTGAEQVRELVKIAGKLRIGLFANHTARVGERHLLDTLLACGVNVTRIYSPEHGFRGDADAGEDVGNTTDPKTGIAIVSLYGPSKKPSPEQLAAVDLVFFDMQDIGVRFFTYISSLHYMMEACARDGKTLVVLDRPNPNGGYVDGPVLKKEFRSFVGMHPVPIVHGMTLGEYAKMVNGEGWLEGGRKCELRVVPVQGWRHGDPWAIPVKPSPNLTSDHAIRLYPSSCLFEGTSLSIGRGTHHPFEQAGHPKLKGRFDHSFTPVSIPGMSKTPPHQDQECFGIDLRRQPITDHIQLEHLITMYKAYPEPDKFFISYFEKLAGTAELRQQIISGMSAESIRAGWQPELEAFRKIRSRYLLYP